MRSIIMDDIRLIFRCKLAICRSSQREHLTSNLIQIHLNSKSRKIALSMPKKPRRTSSCGFQTGLTTILTALSDDYHSSIYSSYGFRVCYSCLIELRSSRLSDGSSGLIRRVSRPQNILSAPEGSPGLRKVSRSLKKCLPEGSPGLKWVCCS